MCKCLFWFAACICSWYSATRLEGAATLFLGYHGRTQKQFSDAQETAAFPLCFQSPADQFLPWKAGEGPLLLSTKKGIGLTKGISLPPTCEVPTAAWGGSPPGTALGQHSQCWESRPALPPSPDCCSAAWPSLTLATPGESWLLLSN